MKIRRKKQRTRSVPSDLSHRILPFTVKSRSHEVLSPIPPVSSIPPSETGEPSSHHDFETMSNFSWDTIASDNLSGFGEEDWEDLESVCSQDTLDYELDQGLARSDSDHPSTSHPQRTYAQALGKQLGERQR